MPIFLADPPTWLYLVLGGVLVVTAIVAAQYQDRRSAFPFGVAFLLMLTVFLIDRSFESPREEAVRRTDFMQVAIDARDPAAFVEHVADSVEIKTAGPARTISREELKKHPFWETLKAYNVKVAVWDFARDDVKDLGNGTIEIGFMGKGTPKDGGPIPIYLRATFTRQSDGTYKLSGLQTFEPLDHTKPVTIPGLF